MLYKCGNTADAFVLDLFYCHTGIIVRYSQVNVQQMVEKPNLYIFAKCRDSIAEKLSYVDARMEDIEELRNDIHMNNGIYRINLYTLYERQIKLLVLVQWR